MSLTKQVSVKKIEFEDSGVMRLVEITEILENGKVVARTPPHRKVILPDDAPLGLSDDIAAARSAFLTVERRRKWDEEKARQGTPKANPL